MSQDRTVDCVEALTHLAEFLDSELPDDDGDAIRRHLAECEPCLAAYDAQDLVKKLVRRSCCEQAPTELHLRIRTRLAVWRTGDFQI